MVTAAEKTTAEEAKAAAEAATTQETFNFAEAIQDKTYPEFTVPVYLDEKSVQELLDLDEELNFLETKAQVDALGVDKSKRYQELVTKRDELIETLRASKYTVLIKGIAPEAAVELEKQAEAAYPQEYTEGQNPITGQTIKSPIENDKRDELVSMLFRQAHIVKVTNPAGAVDEDFADIEKIRVMYKRLPLVSRVKLDEAIQKATVSVDYYREIADEVF